MSIWCSMPGVGHDDSLEARPIRGGEVRTYAEGFSNHHPDLSGSHELPAHVEVAHIAPWCSPDHEECPDCDDHVGAWARLTVYAAQSLSWWGPLGSDKPKRSTLHASIVLDEPAARQLAADLLAWADRPKV